MKKKLIKMILSLLILFSILVPSYSASAATSTSYAESLVKSAEYNANILRKQISYEYTKSLSMPNMILFNQTKDSYTKASKAVSSLKSSSTKTQLQMRLTNNVKLHIDRAVAYIDALNAGKKIEFYSKALNSQVEDEIYMLPRTSEYYHKMSSEIRKQAVLLYRVYGKSTRDAILTKYKKPAEELKHHLAYFVTVYDLIDKGFEEISHDEVDIYSLIDLLIDANDLMPYIQSPSYPEHVYQALQSDMIDLAKELSYVSEAVYEGSVFDSMSSEDGFQQTMILHFPEGNETYTLESPFKPFETQIISLEHRGCEYTIFINPNEESMPQYFILDVSKISE
ncbi:hypothetical protein [Rossellomorea vietnamensis]|uniref:hypothetical protein n=1 Tax=Rossellomorea vietnamensis TaxID=218284 RepID=UPI003D27DC8E